jgi:hypothetical protein
LFNLHISKKNNDPAGVSPIFSLAPPADAQPGGMDGVFYNEQGVRINGKRRCMPAFSMHSRGEYGQHAHQRTVRGCGGGHGQTSDAAARQPPAASG